jgi:TrmH family RNA methyltransferase
MAEDVLQKIRIVLVEPTHPGNIGAVARAMKNMGLVQLALVNPQQFPHADATARASGADDILAAADCWPDLDQALSGCSLVIGASARLRSLRIPPLDARQCAQLSVSEAARSEVALLFGREHSGLTNEELGRCHYLMHIPSNAEFSSLNLAAAVQVMGYELRMACLAGVSAGEAEDPQELPASAEEMARFYTHLQQTLEEIGFLDPQNPRMMMRRLRRLFNRARPNQVEMNILRGILTAAQKQAQQKTS